MTRFPVLLSIPHGGTDAPEFLRDRIALSPAEEFADGDAFTREIYGLPPEEAVVIENAIARAYVDMNRAPDDRPPANPDGVIKTRTCHGRPVYRPGLELDDALAERILDAHYHPYHRAIESALAAQPDLRLGLDCHSMEPVGPAIAPDSGQPRPLLCLGNNHGQSCPDGAARRLADCLRQAFELGEEDVTLNRPFAGGYLTRRYGGHPLPWIQIEMNRSLYLAEPWFDRSRLKIDAGRLADLQSRFREALILFFES